MDQKISERLQALPIEKRKELAKLLEQKRRQSAGQLSKQYDVVIMGAGLAGGTLARQLKKADPTINLLLVEKQQYPLPEVAHKVGESSIELGSYYLRDVVGAVEHLETAQLPKAGLRYFFPTGDNQDITQRVELGCTKVLPTPSHQLDRGRFENMLHEDNVKAGVDCWADCRVKGVDFGNAQHQITIVCAGKEEKVAARWVVDASGRAGVLKRQLGLQKDADHDASAVWFRIDDEINVADWTEDSTWQARVPRHARHLSTTHLMGRGYWVWLIPLPSGATSVGIVADNKLHPHGEMNRFERALDWLERYEPQCAQAVKARQDKLQDFRALRHYAHDCQQVFSQQRWCLTGEAGVFVDPFYSPGTDFIGISNTLITTLILKDRQGQPIDQDAELYNRLYLDTFHSFLCTYAGQYPLMGNAQVMTAKVVWDFSIYWGMNALLFFHHKTQDLSFWQELRHTLAHFDNLNIRMQQFFRDWDAVCAQSQWSPDFVNYMNVQFIHDLHVSLEDGLDDIELKTRVIENVNLLELIAEEMFQHAGMNFSSLRELSSPVEQRQSDNFGSAHGGQDTVNGRGNHQALTSTNLHNSAKYDVKEELGKIWLDMKMPLHANEVVAVA
ncbi:NAD(P)/FAD-dependent oxidoreductase [Chloroflexi bacterium TSY]|nr:NAD(P)/FAD-dependent oxidoreductase [Chloroflexi bacterium TSY]